MKSCSHSHVLHSVHELWTSTVDLDVHSFYPCLQHYNFTSIDETIHLHFQKTSLVIFLNWPMPSRLNIFGPSSRGISVHHYLYYLFTITHGLAKSINNLGILKHQLSTWPTQHIVQKFPNASCFVKDANPSMGFVFNQFPNLGTGGPKCNLQSRLCTWFSTWVMHKTQSRGERGSSYSKLHCWCLAIPLSYNDCSDGGNTQYQ